ncbi:MAG: aminopeptidase P family protein [Betaproteobacteria bacterium]|nr:aminopeptidase P family protein [Betaproteobacteria bacterium]
MPGALARERLEKVRALCRNHGWDALLVYGNAWRCDYLRYVSNFPILEGHGFALIEAEGGLRLFLESPMEAERASIEAPGCEIVCQPGILAVLAAHLEHSRGRRLAAAPMRLMPYGVAGAAGDALEDAGDAFDRLLMQKSELEIDAVRRAARMADAGYEVFRRAARPGRTEYELVADVEAFFRSQGCPDNFMIIGSGGREVRGMHPPGERRLRAGDLVTTELTPCIDGYYAQICRTLVIGPPTVEQNAAFGLYVQSMEAGLAAVRPGATAAEIAWRENDVFRARGLGEYTTNKYTRVRGHGLGLYVDSRPALLEDVDTPLTEGMTIIVHPNTYHPDVGYIVLGDSAVVRSDGPEVLTATPRSLFSVPA